MDVSLIITRLKEQVPDLGGRVAGAAALAQMMAQNGLPQVTPAAHVLPTGIMGGRETAQTGMYRQEIERLFAIVLSVRSHDGSGSRALGTVEALIEAVVLALAGWTPDPATGGFRLKRVALARFAEGMAVYEITVGLPDQLRIMP